MFKNCKGININWLMNKKKKYLQALEKALKKNLKKRKEFRKKIKKNDNSIR